MDSPDDPAEKPVGVNDDSVTSDDALSDESDVGGFTFNNNIASGDTGDQLADREQKRVVDLVRLQPTKNSELQDQWGLDSGSEIHQYLESELKEYYERDDDGYIRATDAAEEFAQNHQDVYQDVTQPTDDRKNPQENLQQRDLLINLVTLTQDLGHLPTIDEVNEYGEYPHQRYREEFGDLFKAYQEAGILPDDITRADLYGEKTNQPTEEDQTRSKADPSSEPDQGIKEAGVEGRKNSGDGKPTESVEKSGEETEINISELDVDRPDFENSEDIDESDLINEIRRFGEKIGEPPSEDLVLAYGRYRAEIFNEYFESWDTALKAAGYDPDDLPDWKQRNYTNVEILDVIRSIASGLGRAPTTTETGKRAPFSHGLGSVRFGGWATALELAGLDPSKRPSVDSSDSYENKKTTTDEENTDPSASNDEYNSDNSKPGEITGNDSTRKKGSTSKVSDLPQSQESSDEMEAEDDPINSVIDDTLEDILSEDGDDDEPFGTI